MAKAVIIALSADIPDAEQGQNVTVTAADGTTYPGTITAIIVYTPPASPPAIPAVTKITLEGPGLAAA
jgi:hypothetical protein